MLSLVTLPHLFSVCKLPDASEIDWAAPYTFVAQTDEELSLVCPTANVPANVLQQEDDWQALRVQGPLNFTLTGVLAQISGALAGAGIPLFAVSTFDTDYVLVRRLHLERAKQALLTAGCRLV